MRRKDKEITDPAQVYDVVKRARFCRIAMCDGDEPYVFPVNYGYSEGVLYVHSAPEGRKLDILERNDRICFQMDTDVHLSEGEKACDWSLSYRSVIGYGRCRVLRDPDEIKEGLKILMAHYSQKDFEITDSDLSGVVVLKIEIDEASGKQSGF